MRQTAIQKTSGTQRKKKKQKNVLFSFIQPLSNEKFRKIKLNGQLVFCA